MTVDLFRKSHLAAVFTCCLALALGACGGSGGDTPTTSSATTSSSSSSTSSASSSSSVANRAPTISGTPITAVLVGASYSFQVSAQDADGDVLAFSRAGTLPPGLNFSTATGLLSGTPNTAGTYAGIVISVSDGKGGTASLPAFTITVSPATGGSAVLSWSAPMFNTDGSALTDLTGYKVYYGTSPSSLTNSVSIASGTTSTTITQLATGQTYYFAIASVSASGGEGDKSNVASKTI